MKRIIQLALVVIALGLYACGGGGSKSGNTSSSDNSSGNESGTIDVTKASDSKGVGEFTEVDIPDQIDAAKAAKGKDIFGTKCMTCHQLGTQAMIGPGLKNVTKIRTPEWILNMITNPTEMLQKDPVAKALLKEFNGTMMTDQGVTKEEARQILAYLRQNDS